MGDREDPGVSSGARDQVARLRQIVRHRFVGHVVEAGVQRGDSVRIVGIVRRHDRDRIRAIRPLRFTIDQFGDVAVASRRVKAQCDAAASGARGVAGEHAADDAPVTVELGGSAVHFSDPGTGSAADDRQPQRPAETGS